MENIEMPTTIPADDLTRKLTIAGPKNDASLCHLCLAGGIYTILVTGKETAGQYCLIDMTIPPGGGPPPHRHNFEELFIIQEGEISFNFRGEKKLVSAGEVINIPVNAPHNFQNSSDKTAKMLCMCSPAGQDEYFMEVGDILKSRTDTPPVLTEAEQMARKQKAQDLALRYQTEFI